jgi:hypothetical protein
MAHLMLNCPRCRKRLTYVPLDGLTLHFRCEEHGLVVFTPLRLVTAGDQFDVAGSSCAERIRPAHDAA